MTATDTPTTVSYAENHFHAVLDGIEHIQRSIRTHRITLPTEVYLQLRNCLFTCLTRRGDLDERSTHLSDVTVLATILVRNEVITETAAEELLRTVSGSRPLDTTELGHYHALVSCSQQEYLGKCDTLPHAFIPALVPAVISDISVERYRELGLSSPDTRQMYTRVFLNGICDTLYHHREYRKHREMYYEDDVKNADAILTHAVQRGLVDLDDVITLEFGRECDHVIVDLNREVRFIERTAYGIKLMAYLMRERGKVFKNGTRQSTMNLVSLRELVGVIDVDTPLSIAAKLLDD
jgi:hypothetical protein